MFWNGNSAMDGLSGSASGWDVSAEEVVGAVGRVACPNLMR